MKKMILALIAILSLLFLTSCDLGLRYDQPELYLITAGIQYGEKSVGNYLKNTQNDEEGFRNEMIALAKEAGMPYHALSLRDSYERHEWDSSYKRFVNTNGSIVFNMRSSGLDALGKSDGVDYIDYRDEDFSKMEKDYVINAFKVGFSVTGEGMPDENDLVVFYFAGHGGEHTGNLWICPGRFPMDSGNNEKPECFIDYEDIFGKEGILSAFESQRKLVILDSCYSGAIADIERGENSNLQETKPNNNIAGGDNDPMPNKPHYPYPGLNDPFGGNGWHMGRSLTSRLRTDTGTYTVSLDNTSELNAPFDLIPNVYFLTAAGNDERAADGGDATHSPFTQALLDAMNDHGRTLTLSDLYMRVHSDSPSTQTPQILMNRYDMLLFKFK